MMPDTSQTIRSELQALLDEQNELLKLVKNTEDTVNFGTRYQSWYSRAIKIVEALAPDRLPEFRSYYEVDRKRKAYSVDTYAIQDYVMAFGASQDVYGKPKWDANSIVALRVVNQMQILASLASRLDSVLADVTGHLFAELQDGELRAAGELLKVSARAAGALAGVILERHLQRVAANHKIQIKKANPTIGDLNDPLKADGVYDVPVWRKIQYLGDIRNLCSHSKGAEPGREQVEEMLRGVNQVVKTIF
jgi:hypothetical protein